MSQGYTLSQLQEHLGGEILGDPDTRLMGVASLEHAGPEHLSFVVSPKLLNNARQSRAAALLVPPKLAGEFTRPVLSIANPHAAFARATALFHPEPRSAPGIHPSAVLGAGSQVPEDASIGPGVVIGAQVRIGARSRIEAGTVIGDGVSLGEDCHLYPRVTIYPGCQLGDRVILHAGCVIGSDGFGLAWTDDGWLKVPQVGKVRLGNDVEIGANTTIDRGALDDTVIEDGVKIDNLVQIAHNCVIGAHTAIAGCAGIAGSTRIGRHCLIGGAAMILGHIEIGDRVTVSGASFIGKSIREPGVYTSTQPQMPHDEWLRNAAQLRHLSDMRDRLRALEKKIAELEKQST